MEVERYEHGVPSWVDLGTPDIPKARKVTRVSAIRSAATSGRSREWAYPVAGTLIAGLLIYTAVFGLKPLNQELRGSQTAGWREATPIEDSASAPVAQIARSVPKTDEPETARVSLETSETQIPMGATASAESVTSAPTVLPDVAAPAPTFDTPMQNMPAEERTLVYPTTNFSEKLPPPQAAAQPQTTFAGSPLLAPAIPRADNAQNAYGQQPSLPGNRQGQTLDQPPMHPVYSQSQMPNYPSVAPGGDGPGQQSIERVRLNGNIEPFPTMQR